ncbi:hypothetical protein V8E53_014293 [Lactarius tabidus]
MYSQLYRDSASPDLNTTMGMILIGLIVDSMKAIRHHVLSDLFVFYERHEGPSVLARAGRGVMVRISQLRRAIAPGFVFVAERGRLTVRTLNTLQLALLCYTTYYFLVLCYGESEELAVSIWSLNLEIAPSVIATFMANSDGMADLQLRSFFTVRLWHREPSFLIAAQYVPDDSVAVSQGNRTLICTIMAFALPQLGIGLG